MPPAASASTRSAQKGVIGYIARPAIDAILGGGQADLASAVFVYELTPGEGAENGIAASRAGTCAVFAQNAYDAVGNKRSVPFYG